MCSTGLRRWRWRINFVFELSIMSHCIHYGICGGCAVDDRHAIDKPARLSLALTRAGYAPVLAPLIETPLHTRRRADLAATRKHGEISLGLHKARGAEVVDMRECVLLRQEMVALLPEIRILLRSLQAFRSAGSVVINWLDHGADILLRMDAAFTGPDKTKIISFARTQGILRMSIATGTEFPEPVIILGAPSITFSGAPVEPAPGGFLQASAEGEAAIIAAVLAGLPKFTKKSLIIELFAGAGTLSFALAQHARVEAYEGDAAAASALDKAIRTNNLAGRLSVALRDLHRRPLQAADLAKAAVVVLDPPFAGAAMQMRFLAMSGVKRIVYVSCNPEALATDVVQLRHAGYSLLAATPIDQFPYSENVESVVVFEKVK
jgi:23S rRNA (uracil1939-C5)-methyltransferase